MQTTQEAMDLTSQSSKIRTLYPIQQKQGTRGQTEVIQAMASKFNTFLCSLCAVQTLWKEISVSVGTKISKWSLRTCNLTSSLIRSSRQARPPTPIKWTTMWEVTQGPPFRLQTKLFPKRCSINHLSRTITRWIGSATNIQISPTQLLGFHPGFSWVGTTQELKVWKMYPNLSSPQTLTCKF